MTYFRLNICLFLLILLCTSCNECTTNMEPKLLKAETLLQSHPDSALQLLEEMYPPVEMNAYNQAYYYLSLAEAHSECEEALSPLDSLIDWTIDYADAHQEKLLLAKACLYKGKICMEQENPGKALANCQRAWDLLDEENTQLLEINSDWGNLYPETGQYEKISNRHRNNYVMEIIAGVFALLFLIVLRIFMLRRKQKNIEQEEESHQENPDQEKLKLLQDQVDDLQCKMFRMKPVYAKIQQLSQQGKIPREGKKVLNPQDRILLKEEITVCFAELIHQLKTAYPSIKDEDIELCCLAKLGLPLTVICLCFGFVESDSLRQRKHQLKRKLEKEYNSPELFRSIFETKNPKRSIQLKK